MHTVNTCAVNSLVFIGSFTRSPTVDSFLKGLFKWDTQPFTSAASGNLNDDVPEWVESSKMVPFRVPTLQHVLQWLALLFDAHITSFHKQAGSVEVLFLLNSCVCILLMCIRNSLRPMAAQLRYCCIDTCTTPCTVCRICLYA